uniref:YqaJ-like recombinase n=1 Tax=Pithovirus LCPAC104 TaxID=2506589 RepID=A0A481Z430_9VIRU|nr:MAG: YqaJ-like recombinase [Pithovirus LCPAC104]
MEIENLKRWKEEKSYFIFKDEQGTEDWKKLHLFRISGSSIGSCIGHSKFSTPEETGKKICGINKPNFTEIELNNMKYGTDLEPIARKYFENKYNLKVEELGMVIPKWNKYLGVSVDGVIKNSDCIIEIKCVKKMYYPLKNYVKNNKELSDYSHIWKSHYDQMILGMKILEKKYCYYFVFCPNDKIFFKQKIPFNEEYWNSIYKKTLDFIEKYIKPFIEDNKYPIIPKNWKNDN